MIRLVGNVKPSLLLHTIIIYSLHRKIYTLLGVLNINDHHEHLAKYRLLEVLYLGI